MTQLRADTHHLFRVSRRDPGRIDGRTRLGRRRNQLLDALGHELGELSAHQQLTLRTAIDLHLTVEKLSGEGFRGKAVDAEVLCRMANASARLLDRLSREKGAQPQEPTLAQILASGVPKSGAR